MLKNAAQQDLDAEKMIRAGEAMVHGGDSKAMLQAGEEPAGPPPPPGLKPYSNGAASGGVLAMLMQLIEDSEAMIKEAVGDETEALKAYEVYVKDANAETKIRSTEITNRRMEMGKLEMETEETKVALNETIQIKAELRQHDIDLYGVEGCDYLLKNYAVRFVERKEEIDSLKEAEAILGVGGGDPKMAAAAHAEGDVSTITEAPTTPEPPEAAAGSQAEVVP